MSSSSTNETKITVLLKYSWSDQESFQKFGNDQTVESPLFGPENFEMIKFKFRLFIDDETGECAIDLILVSSMEHLFNFDYKIILYQASDTKLAKCDQSVDLSAGEELTVLRFYDASSIRSIHGEFELKLPKLEPKIRTLIMDLNFLRLNARFTDVTFVVGKKSIPAHKNILSARSPVFAVMFGREEFVENQQNRVDVTDVDEKVFEALLDFIYTSQVKQLDEITPELFVAAHKYNIESLVQLCTQKMLNSISNENVVDYLLHANVYNLAELKSKAIDFINKNAREITNREDWIEHVMSNHSLMTELYLDLVDKHTKAYYY